MSSCEIDPEFKMMVEKDKEIESLNIENRLKDSQIAKLELALLKANINSNINNEQNAKDVQLAEQKCAIIEKDVEILQLKQLLSKLQPQLVFFKS
jgi:hypothetical protein